MFHLHGTGLELWLPSAKQPVPFCVWCDECLSLKFEFKLAFKNLHVPAVLKDTEQENEDI